MGRFPLRDFFDRVVLINLKRRPDRLARTMAALNACKWPFAKPQVFEAIDGSTLPRPPEWKFGSGAWGCLKSHQAILSKALADGAKSILVLEDDVCFVDDFTQWVAEFLHAVPKDWDQLMLGGQHLNQDDPPVLIKPGILRCTDCERTHCYAVRGAYMRKLCDRWESGGKFNGMGHCDWIMGRDPELQRAHKVYAPVFFLAGQRRDKSDIYGALQPRKLWNPPRPNMRVINLHAPPAVAGELGRYGLRTSLNRGKNLAQIFSETQDDPSARIQALSRWINTMQWELAADPAYVCAVWHSQAVPELVRAASPWPVLEVTASDVPGALAQLPRQYRKPVEQLRPSRFIVHLRAPKRVMDGLRAHGWHNGYRLCASRGWNLDLDRLCEQTRSQEMRLRGLKTVVRRLQLEAMAIEHGLPVIWHPAIDVDLVRMSTSAKVVEIATKSVQDAMAQWQRRKRGRRRPEKTGQSKDPK
jgi:hypothetical protein